MAKKIEELQLVVEKMTKLNVKAAQPNAPCAGLWTSKDKQTLRKVFAGPRGGFHMLTPSKMTLKIGEFEETTEAKAERRIAAHEEWKASSPTK